MIRRVVQGIADTAARVVNSAADRDDEHHRVLRDAAADRACAKLSASRSAATMKDGSRELCLTMGVLSKL